MKTSIKTASENVFAKNVHRLETVRSSREVLVHGIILSFDSQTIDTYVAIYGFWLGSTKAA